MIKTTSKFTRAEALQLLSRINNKSAFLLALRQKINELPKGKSSTWRGSLEKIEKMILSNFQEIPFSIFYKGNTKLPFVSFSSLPLADCPGMGACQNFCYSLSAWMYPSAFSRQLQNSLLLRYKREKIKKAFLSIGEKETVRLYVDGDFATKEILSFWMKLTKQRKDLNVYGYSKSWQLFLDLHKENFQWPENYFLNLSSGSRYGEEVKKKMFSLPIVRGEFVALQVSKEHIKSKAYQSKANKGFPAYAKELIAQAKEKGMKKPFVCLGKCGECLPKGKHACGDAAFRGRDILIGVH